MLFRSNQVNQGRLIRFDLVASVRDDLRKHNGVEHGDQDNVELGLRISYLH